MGILDPILSVVNMNDAHYTGQFGCKQINKIQNTSNVWNGAVG